MSDKSSIFFSSGALKPSWGKNSLSKKNLAIKESYRFIILWLQVPSLIYVSGALVWVVASSIYLLFALNLGSPVCREFCHLLSLESNGGGFQCVWCAHGIEDCVIKLLSLHCRF